MFGICAYSLFAYPAICSGNGNSIALWFNRVFPMESVDSVRRGMENFVGAGSLSGFCNSERNRPLCYAGWILRMFWRKLGKLCSSCCSDERLLLHCCILVPSSVRHGLWVMFPLFAAHFGIFLPAERRTLYGTACILLFHSRPYVYVLVAAH